MANLPNQHVVPLDNSASCILRAYEEASALRLNPLKQEIAALRMKNFKLADNLDRSGHAWVALSQGINMFKVALQEFGIYAGPELPRVVMTEEVKTALEHLHQQERNLSLRLHGLPPALPDVLSPEVLQNASLRQIFDSMAQRLEEYQAILHDLLNAKHEACWKELEVRRDNAHLRDENENFRTENERLRVSEETREQQERALVELTSKNKNLCAENEHLSSENERLRVSEETREQRERALVELTSKNKNLCAENEHLRSEKERLRANGETLEHQEKVLVELDSENKNFRVENQSLRTENERLRANHETLEHQESVLGDLTSENKTLRDESARLRADEETVKHRERVLVAKINNDQNMKQELEKRLISLETENSTLQQRNSDLEKEGQELRGESSARLQRLQNQVSDQDAMIRRLQEDIAEVENGRVENLERTETEKARLQSRLKEVTDELEAMKMRYRDQERDRQSMKNIQRLCGPGTPDLASRSTVPAFTGLGVPTPRPLAAPQASSTPAPKRPAQGYESEAYPKRQHMVRRNSMPDPSSPTVTPRGFFPNTIQRKARQQELLKGKSR